MDFDLTPLPADRVTEALLLARGHIAGNVREAALRADHLKAALRYLDIAIESLRHEEDGDA
ncbi:MAG: hypothetical protein LBQ62_10000 [Candidatus Accumulibacter sp.]|jgi:hypothetical protein|nr:hypothetical protein [Accumulibacter sp.]